MDRSVDIKIRTIIPLYLCNYLYININREVIALENIRSVNLLDARWFSDKN
jgi:hypothetical protein